MDEVAAFVQIGGVCTFPFRVVISVEDQRVGIDPFFGFRKNLFRAKDVDHGRIGVEFRRKHLAAHDDIQGGFESHDPFEGFKAAGCGKQSHIDLRKSHLRAGSGKNPIAGPQHQLETATQRGLFDKHRRHREWTSRQGIEGFVIRQKQVLEPEGGGILGDFHQIGAVQKALCFGGADDHASDAVSAGALRRCR